MDLRALESVITGERNAIANMANTAAFLFHEMHEVNWIGFYLFDGKELVIGPFQGNVACVRIALGRGVCGKAANERTTIIVPDVHAFEDHIVCDAASQSEIVVPILLSSSEAHDESDTRHHRLLGVLDADSPIINRFNNDDAVMLERVVSLLVSGSDWKSR
ncbi:MAG: GAF domain-containing protein [Ignavibacteria bacterium]|nr:GAF domain-containing protein [Ignavibacteria bacterium]